MEQTSNRKARLSQKIFIGLFVGVLGLSFPIFNIFSAQLSMDNHENRLLTTLPDVLTKPISELPEELDEFLADNSPFRYQLVLLNAEINYKLFHTIDSDQVLLGEDGWLFYKTGPDEASPLADYQGMLRFTDAQLEQYAAAVQDASDRLAAAGKTLVVNFTPNKDRMYREYVPDCYPVLYEENLTAQLVAYLKEHTTATVVYSPEAILPYVDEMQLYFKTDTHWNHAGALLALDEVFKELGMETGTFEDYQFVEWSGQQGDMANVAALYRVLDVEPERIPSNYEFEKDSRSIAVWGDSFSEYYMRYLDQRFAADSREALTDFSVDAALSSDKDIVLVEANERSVQTLFDALCPGADTTPVRKDG